MEETNTQPPVDLLESASDSWAEPMPLNQAFADLLSPLAVKLEPSPQKEPSTPKQHQPAKQEPVRETSTDADTPTAHPEDRRAEDVERKSDAREPALEPSTPTPDPPALDLAPPAEQEVQAPYKAEEPAGAVEPSKAPELAKLEESTQVESPAQKQWISKRLRREKAVSDAMRTMVRDLFTERFGHIVPKKQDFNLVLRLRVTLQPDWTVEFTPDLSSQILDQMDDMEAQFEVYQEGRVFCFRCNTSACEHSAPPDALHVFHQYDHMGTPQWKELPQIFLECRDERVGLLFEKPPKLIALSQLGHEVKEQQSGLYGRASKTYSVLAQIVAGYVPIPRGAKQEPHRLAMTFQAVEIRDARGHMRINLNVVAKPPDGVGLDHILNQDWAEWIERAIGTARRDLKQVEQLAHNARREGREDDYKSAMRRIPHILERLALSLERGYKQSTRRSRHAQDRRKMQRPVHKAWEDLKSARLQNLYHDEIKHTIIVCGENGRTHVFNREARHVTSFMIKPGAADFRVRTNRWRPLQQEEFDELRTVINDNPGLEHAINTGAGSDRRRIREDA